ncbi:MAG: S8 family serine peptidase [Xanthobacteraceae bacterium]
MVRFLLGLLLASGIAVHDGAAQCVRNCPPPPPPQLPGDTRSDSNRVGWYALGSVVGVFVGWAIQRHLFPDPPAGEGPPARGLPVPDQPLTQVQLPSSGPPPAPRVGASGTPAPQGPPSGAAAPAAPAVQALRRGFDLPPPGAPCLPDEIILDVPATVNAGTLDAIAGRHGMTRLETLTVRLTGRTLHRWQIGSAGSIESMTRSLSESERLVLGTQCNFLYALSESASDPVNADQYAPQKVNLIEAHRLARGRRVLIAVIDSEVDARHPDLAGAIVDTFEASADDEHPHSHGTGMAGAMAARRTVLGIAPQASLLTVRAFSSRANSVEGTTFNILKGLDWAAEKGARIINMSFAGPSDPRLRDALGKAYKKGIVLIAAAGNAGPNSPPLFPAADPNVIAVTATDTDDALFPGANRGNHIAVAAPGVDILVPAPDGAYQLTTGTSVAAAEVSGAAALLIERNPALTPAAVRKILMDTAKDLGPRGRDRDFGAGLIDALGAVTAAQPR